MFYEILLLITPLITTPYLSRVLGADGVGIVSFSESVVSYFTLVATLGVATFGKREISYVQDSKSARTQIFWDTKALSVITSLIVLIVYIVFSICQDNQVLYLILTFNLLAVTVDITWFFQGMEEFGKIVIRNIIFKVINIIYIFIFVRKPDDLVKYVFGIAFFLFLGNVSLWVYIPQFVEKPSVKNVRPFRNIKTVISLFVPTVAIQVYTVLDKTMIGMITKSAFENGYYEQALKLSRMVLTVVTALGVVMIPRIGYHYGKGEIKEVQSFMYRSYRFVWFLGIPLCCGLIGIASNFVPWFYGEGFDKVVILLKILSFLILSIGINNVTGMQYLIPTKRQNLFTFTVLAGAIINFVLNYFLISLYQSVGAAVASVTAETVIALIQLYLIRNELSLAKVFMSCRNYVIAGIIMLVILMKLGNILIPSMWNTFIMIITGASLYFVILLIERDSFFIDNMKNIFQKIKEKVLR